MAKVEIKEKKAEEAPREPRRPGPVACGLATISDHEERITAIENKLNM